jgi:hypothetical protein
MIVQSLLMELPMLSLHLNIIAHHLMVTLVAHRQVLLDLFL